MTTAKKAGKFDDLFAAARTPGSGGETGAEDRQQSGVEKEPEKPRISTGSSSENIPPESRQDARTAHEGGSGVFLPTPQGSHELTEAFQGAESLLGTGRRRQTGKRSQAGPDGPYMQVTAYVLRDTHASVMRRLMMAKYDAKAMGRKPADSPDFSELVETLLSDWLKTQH